MKLLYESNWYDCNDWTWRHLGNYHCSIEEFKLAMKCFGHPYKNLDSNVKHSLNKDLSKLEVELYFKSFCDTFGYEIFKVNPNSYTLVPIDNNEFKLVTDKRGLVLEDRYNLKVTTEEGQYKIIIKEKTND